MKRNITRLHGLTRIEVLIIVVIIGMLAAIMKPNFIHEGGTPLNACINNLRLLDSAKQQWALKLHKTALDIPKDSDLRPYLGHGSQGELPVCPNDPNHSFATSYRVGALSQKPVCLIVPTTHVLP
jgi:hypothetical protein